MQSSVANYPYPIITASITSGVMTVTAAANGAVLTGGMVTGAGVPPFTFINVQESGIPGGTGIYSLQTYSLVSNFIEPILIPATMTIGSEALVVIPFSQSIVQTMLAQFANSPALVALLNSMNMWVDPAIMLAGFWFQCMNISTATSYGLDRIGRIVGVRRTINPPNYVTNQFLFFKENIPNAHLFGPASGSEPFWDGSTSGSVLNLPDSYFRTLIYVKAMSNISSCSTQALNYMISTLFAGSGNCYWVDQGGMAAQLYFSFDPGALNFYILNTSGAMPRPAGVALTYSIP